jgi:hypothetical protein
MASSRFSPRTRFKAGLSSEAMRVQRKRSALTLALLRKIVDRGATQCHCENYRVWAPANVTMDSPKCRLVRGQRCRESTPQIGRVHPFFDVMGSLSFPVAPLQTFGQRRWVFKARTQFFVLWEYKRSHLALWVSGFLVSSGRKCWWSSSQNENRVTHPAGSVVGLGVGTR